MDDLATADGVTATRAEPEAPTRRSSRELWFRDVACGTAVVAVLVAISMRQSLRYINADSLLYGLMSTEDLTFYYWGQDRLANVVPAIAWPVQDIVWNHLIQTAILSSSFFLLIGLFVLVHARRSGRATSWPLTFVATTVTGVLSLGLLSRGAEREFVLSQQYAFSLLLFLLGLYGVTGSRTAGRLAGATAVLVAVLVIPSTAILAPLGAVVRGGQGVWRRLATSIGVSAASLVVGSIAAAAFGADGSPADAYTDFSVARFRVGFPQTVRSIVQGLEPWTTLVVVLASVVVLVLARHRFDASLRWAYVLCPVLAVGWVALFSSNLWVEMNRFLFRYHFPAFAVGLFVISGAVTEIAHRVAERRRPSPPSTRGSSRGPLVVGAVAMLVVAVSVGVVARTTVPVVEAGHRRASLAGRYDLELVVGDYWQVWPTVFADRADGGDLLPVTYRSDPLLPEVRDIVASLDVVGVLCVDDVPQACADMLSATVGGEWRIVSIAQTDPRVIEVTRG